MSLGDSLEAIAWIVVVASLVVGFWESSQDIGEMTTILDSAISQPTTFLPGVVVWGISMDTWTPGLPVSMLPSWLQWIEIFYPFSEGYIPHFSIWTCCFALIATAIYTFMLLHLFEWEFWWKGFIIAIITFIASWYVFHLLAWVGIGFGANLMGISSESAYSIWSGAVGATKTPLLQYFFLATIPLSLYLIGNKLGRRLV